MTANDLEHSFSSNTVIGNDNVCVNFFVIISRFSLAEMAFKITLGHRQRHFDTLS